jgi:hypothetical protein
MAAVTAPNPAAAVDPNYAALAARYDSDDDFESDEVSHLPSTQPVVQENQHHMTADQQQKQQHTTAAALASDETVGDAAYGANDDYGCEEEHSEEGDEDDELYAALEWADSREGRWEQQHGLVCEQNCASCDASCLLLSAGGSLTENSVPAVAICISNPTPTWLMWVFTWGQSNSALCHAAAHLELQWKITGTQTSEDIVRAV